MNNNQSPERVERVDVPVSIETPPDLIKYIHDKLILLDDYHDVIRVVNVGAITEWEAIKGSASCWLEKQYLSDLLPKAGGEEVRWIKADKPLSEYPTGTKAKAIGGGYWIRNKLGWKWCTGATFPNVGGDWSGEICLPQPAGEQPGKLESWMQRFFKKAFLIELGKRYPCQCHELYKCREMADPECVFHSEGRELADIFETVMKPLQEEIAMVEVYNNSAREYIKGQQGELARKDEELASFRERACKLYLVNNSIRKENAMYKEEIELLTKQIADLRDENIRLMRSVENVKGTFRDIG